MVVSFLIIGKAANMEQYIYGYVRDNQVIVTADFEKVEGLAFCNVEVTQGAKQVAVLHVPEDFVQWRDKLERDFAWKPEKVANGVAAAVDAPHYKGYINDMQWIQAMGNLERFRDLSDGKFYGALELQIRKYLDRLGKKDESVQELLKAKWYLEYLIACMHEKRVVRVEDVPAVLANI